jgi:hypothetical protein
MKRKEKKSNRDFNGDAGVNPMLIIEIHTINTKPFQASLNGTSHIFGVAPNFPLVVGKADTKFGGQFNFVSHSSAQSLFERIQFINT